MTLPRLRARLLAAGALLWVRWRTYKPESEADLAERYYQELRQSRLNRLLEDEHHDPDAWTPAQMPGLVMWWSYEHSFLVDEPGDRDRAERMARRTVRERR